MKLGRAEGPGPKSGWRSSTRSNRPDANRPTRSACIRTPPASPGSFRSITFPATPPGWTESGSCIASNPRLRVVLTVLGGLDVEGVAADCATASGETPLTKLGVSSAIYPSLLRQIPFDHPPLPRHSRAGWGACAEKCDNDEALSFHEVVAWARTRPAGSLATSRQSCEGRTAIPGPHYGWERAADHNSLGMTLWLGSTISGTGDLRRRGDQRGENRRGRFYFVHIWNNRIAAITSLHHSSLETPPAGYQSQVTVRRVRGTRQGRLHAIAGRVGQPMMSAAGAKDLGHGFNRA
jgi:hypothetical protein